jgi:GNAT superfamily N-acetyltransferase
MAAHHLPGLVDLHLVTSLPRSLMPLMGRHAISAFYRWWIGRKDVVALVAETKGAVVGHVLGPLEPSKYGAIMYRDTWPSLGLGVAHALLRHPIMAARMLTRRINLVRAGLAGVVSRARRLLSSQDKPYKQQARPIPMDYASGYEKIVTLLSIGVDPRWQGHGLGRRLTDEFCYKVKQAGATHVRLSVRNDNPQAIGFYEANGWRCIARSAQARVYLLELE